MKKKLIPTGLTLIAIFFAITFTTKAEVNVKPGNVYEIVEIISGTNSEGSITDFIFLDESGNKSKLSEYTKGKYVFQNFWGTWCPPCRAEIPDIIKLQSELSDKLVMIGIALEKTDAAKEGVINFAKSQGMNYINFVAPNSIKQKLIKTYGGIPAVPTTFLADKNGKIVEKIVGMKTKEEFQTALNKLMK